MRVVQHAFPPGSQSPRLCWLRHIFGGSGASSGIVPTGKMAKKLLHPPHLCFPSLGLHGGGQEPT